jgi:hypothetical protein
MVKINKGATLVGRIQYTTGRRNVVEFWLDYNRNTGKPILWQRMPEWAASTSRYTGRNLRLLIGELNDALNKNEAVWMEGPNDKALDALKELI